MNSKFSDSFNGMISYTVLGNVLALMIDYTRQMYRTFVLINH